MTEADGNLRACTVLPSAASVAAGCEPFSANRLTPASRNSGAWQGTMAAGARDEVIRACRVMDFILGVGGVTIRATARETTRATVGREESLSNSPQRPTCSRRRPYIPAAVPAQWFRLMVFR